MVPSGSQPEPIEVHVNQKSYILYFPWLLFFPKAEHFSFSFSGGGVELENLAS